MHQTGAAAALALWSELVCELLLTIQGSIDPDHIVLGGGLSKIPDVKGILGAQMQKTLMQGLPLPRLSVARFGDASGVRGAAMLHAFVDQSDRTTARKEVTT